MIPVVSQMIDLGLLIFCFLLLLYRLFADFGFILGSIFGFENGHLLDPQAKIISRNCENFHGHLCELDLEYWARGRWRYFKELTPKVSPTFFSQLYSYCSSCQNSEILSPTFAKKSLWFC